DFAHLPLKPDHAARPLWVLTNGRIVLEAFSPIAHHAMDFLIAVAEPVSRPRHVHEYKLTETSLYAAVSIGLDATIVLNVLTKFAKNQLDDSLVATIRKYTQSYGKVKLVLKSGRFYVESEYESVLRTLLADPRIAASRIDAAPEAPRVQTAISSRPGHAVADPPNADADPSKPPPKADPLAMSGNDGDDDDDNDAADDFIMTASFEIDPLQAEQVREASHELEHPMQEEYDFAADVRNPSLDIDLKPLTKLRPYQEQALSKMFGGGRRARSGMIVLPCGAGKTLVGVTAASTIKKSVLVLCTSSVSVEQWSREFRAWSTLQDGQIAKFTSDAKDRFVGDAGVMISTYTMVTFTGKRAYDAQKMMDFLQSREWGLLILDEVHVVPAEIFRKVLVLVKTHAKLGLTATLVREDDKIKNLKYLIGPKLFEANWLDLASKGHIATVDCAEVLCPMAAPFYREYITEPTARKRQLLAVMNPHKIQLCQFLIQMHEARGDKIIVFSDNVFALKHYATTIGRPYLYGGTSQAERLRILQNFRYNPALNTIFLSKIGDTSVDLPEANCLIQISSQYGSRRQEAQRLGRILRSKRGRGMAGGGSARAAAPAEPHSTAPPTSGGPPPAWAASTTHDAHFYTLLSRNTEETYYSTKRQQFLIDQGYAFRVISTLTADAAAAAVPHLAYRTKAQQLELLATLRRAGPAGDSDASSDEMEGIDGFDGAASGHGATRPRPGGLNLFVRRAGTLKSLSGGDTMAYMEINK
ncbi:hypothetical protein CXG81DRAFT_1831, partial [Caulochytrium protostelioides]